MTYSRQGASLAVTDTGDGSVQPSEVVARGNRSVAAKYLFGTVVTGDGARITVLPPNTERSPHEVSAPRKLSNLPGSAARLFVGRSRELDRVERVLSADDGAAITQVCVIHGLGGVGKTSLAMQYAHQQLERGSYTAAWWIRAETLEQIDSSLAALAVSLNSNLAATSPQEQTAWAVAWLQCHEGWLLVFDNVENPTDLVSYLGKLTGGHHLITSRRSVGWHNIAPTVSLGALDPESAVELLHGLALPEGKPSRQQQKEAIDLATELGFLPIALEQAGAYICQTGISYAAFRMALPAMFDEAAEGIDPERTISRIWTATLDAILGRDALAANIVSALAWYASDSFPRDALANAMIPIAGSVAKVDRALGVLNSYSLISLSVDEISIHRILQAVLRAEDEIASRQFATEDGDCVSIGRQLAELVMRGSLPLKEMPRGRECQLWDLLLPHIYALVESAPSGYISEELCGICLLAVQHLDERGQWVGKVPLRQAVLAHRERILGPDHRDTLVSLRNLALACTEAGDFERAILLHKTVLAACERVLGSDHIDLLYLRSNLAHAYAWARDLESAVRLLMESLKQAKRLLGVDHPDTLAIRRNLVGIYAEMGDLEFSTALLADEYERTKVLYGVDHPETLACQNNLARAHAGLGEFEIAIALHWAVLGAREQMLGESHIDVLNSRYNLADTYVMAGRLHSSVPLLEDSLAQALTVLGAEHPQTLAIRQNLVEVRVRIGESQG
ncbi:tetratricopeptide repeat protein [Kitasatospora griseola]